MTCTYSCTAYSLNEKNITISRNFKIGRLAATVRQSPYCLNTEESSDNDGESNEWTPSSHRDRREQLLLFTGFDHYL